MTAERKPLQQKGEIPLEDIVDTVLLDIDGVICESQQPVTLEMQAVLQRLARQKLVYFVTGNHYTKSIDLLNGPIAMYGGIFNNTADELRSMRGKLIWRDETTPPLPSEIEQTLRTVYQPNKANCIEWRTPRFINFSKIGRYATLEERKSHDASWRDGAVEFLRWRYPEVETVIGGSVSIDIYSKGADKSRAAKWLNERGRRFAFIGDKTEPGGNDFSVKKYIESNPQNICFTSLGCAHTIQIIEELLGEKILPAYYHS